MTKTKEQQQRRILEYKNFDLKKFKVTKDGVDVTHYEKGDDGGEVSKKGESEAHPDLNNALKELQLYMATRLGLLQGWDFSREHLKKSSDALKEAIERHKETVASCNVNGLTFVGDGETSGVIITGSISLPAGGSVGLAVPKITFGKEDLGYEDDVEELCEAIRKEVYAYRFQNKKAQLDIETEIAKQENPDLFEESKVDEKKLEVI